MLQGRGFSKPLCGHAEAADRAKTRETMARNHFILSVFLCPLAVGGLLAAGWASEQEMAPAQLLEAYTSAMSWFQHCDMEIESRTIINGFSYPLGEWHDHARYHVWRDGSRSRYVLSRTIYAPDRSGLRTLQEHIEKLYPERGFIWVAPHEGQVWVGSEQAPKGPPVIVARLNELPEVERSRAHRYNLGPITDGYLAWNDPLMLPQILRESTVTARRKTIDGRALWIMDSSGNWGHHILWLDPAMNFLPRRIRQEKRADDWVAPDKPVRALAAVAGTAYPKMAYKKITQDVVVTKCERVQNVPVPVQFRQTEVDVLQNGRSATTESHFSLSNVRINPDFSTAFMISTPIPNGTPVQVDDAPGINYEWQDGKIVKSINQPAVASLWGYRFLPSSWLARSLTALAAAAMVLLLIYWRYRRRTVGA